MTQALLQIAIVVRDYDEALAFYVGILGFSLIEDTYLPAQDTRWVVVTPSQTSGARILLARASNAAQMASVGNQTGGRVFLFLHTDDVLRDFERYRSQGVEFVRLPKAESYGKVAVFKDLYGNLWDLIQHTSGHA
jgi:catechol 2,3-dioxygenase-like lactoylglutathione lyase family enzyme